MKKFLHGALLPVIFFSMMLFLIVALLTGMVVHVPAKTDSFLGEAQQIRNVSSMSLLHTPANKKEHRDSRKRKHAEEEGNNENGGGVSGEITLCWPNALLRECKQVTVSREFYNILRDHHVGGMVECLCVTEGFDHFESQKGEPLFIDGRVFDTFPRYMEARYSGEPLPHMDMAFLDSSRDATSEDRGDTNVVCWQNSLLGECQEADITQAEVAELLTGGNGYDLDIDMCSCASDGFTSVKKDNDDETGKSELRYAGVQTYSPPPRVTLCFFDGQTPDDHMWVTDDNVKIQKGEMCKQVTIDRHLYHSTNKSQNKKKFNDAGVSECQGGCPELGYGVTPAAGLSTQQKHLKITIVTGKAAGDRKFFNLLPNRDMKTSPGEWVYTYYTKEHGPRVTLCFFDGKEQKGYGVNDASSEMQWWKPTEGVMVRKRQFCKQVTISRELYTSRARTPGRKEKLNQYGIYECGEGGCDKLGYGVFVKSKEIGSLFIRPEKPEGVGAYSDGAPSTKKKTRIGKRHGFYLTPSGSKQRERVDTYTSSPMK